MNDLIISRYTKQYTKVLQGLQKKNFIKNLNQSMHLTSIESWLPGPQIGETYGRQQWSFQFRRNKKISM